jgi:hypothetical protein
LTGEYGSSYLRGGALCAARLQAVSGDTKVVIITEVTTLEILGNFPPPYNHLRQQFPSSLQVPFLTYTLIICTRQDPVLRARRHVHALLQADASCDVAALVKRDVERLGQAGITGEEEVVLLFLSLLSLLSLMSLLSLLSCYRCYRCYRCCRCL